MASMFDPFQEVLSLRDAMDRLVQQSFVDPARIVAEAVNAGSGVRAMPLEIYQTPDDVVVKALLPGVSPEHLTVTYEQGVLTLQGATEPPAAHDNWTWHAREFGYGRFARAISLPVAIDADRAQASFKDGILTLTLPKAPTAKPRQIRIATPAQIGGGATTGGDAPAEQPALVDAAPGSGDSAG